MKTLSKTELKVTHLIANGYSVKQIAFKLFVSFHTAHTHCKNIHKKLNANNVADVTRIYMLQVLPKATDVLKALTVVFFVSLQVHIIFYQNSMDLRRSKTNRISRIVRTKGKNKLKYLTF